MGLIGETCSDGGRSNWLDAQAHNGNPEALPQSQLRRGCSGLIVYEPPQAGGGQPDCGGDVLDAASDGKILQRRFDARVDRNRSRQKIPPAQQSHGVPNSFIGVAFDVGMPESADVFDGGLIERDCPTVTGAEFQKPRVDEHLGGLGRRAGGMCDLGRKDRRGGGIRGAFTTLPREMSRNWNNDLPGRVWMLFNRLTDEMMKDHAVGPGAQPGRRVPA
ncbi:MAG TPA: hypothetical protein VF082_00300 [Jiangellaceae bacterium]